MSENQKTILDAYTRWYSGMLTGYELSLIVASAVEPIEIEQFKEDTKLILETL